MHSFWKSYSTTAYLAPAVFVVLLVTGIGAGMIVQKEIRKDAIVAAKLQANVIIDYNLAVHSYFNQMLKPEVMNTLGHDLEGPGYFEPVWMSSTYAIRKIQEKFAEFNYKGFIYKEAAINARHPNNEAEAFERDFLQRLNADYRTVEETEIRTIDGEEFLVVMRKGEVIEERCLRCHSQPEKAPAELLKLYGKEKSFGREVGEVVSVLTIRVPLSVINANSQRKINMAYIYLTLLFVFIFLLNKHVSKKLIFTNAALRAIIEASPLAIISFDQKGLVRNWNRAAERIFGWRREEVIGRPYPIVPEEQMEEFNRNVRWAGIGVRFVGMDTLRQRKDNSKLVVSIFGAAMYNHTGQVIGTMALLQDITDRKKAEEVLRASREKLHAVIEESPLAIAVMDGQGYIQSWNPAAQRIFEWGVEEVIGLNPIIDTEFREQFENLRQQVLNGEVVKGIELTLKKRGGSPVCVRLFTSSLHDHKGNISGIMAIMEDVTEEKQAQEELTEARKKTEQALKTASLGAMTAAVAHEINQPLNSLKVTADGMLYWYDKGKTLEPEKVHNNLRKISAQVDRITEIIQHMRTIIKKQSSSKVRPCNLNEVIDKVLKTLSHEIAHSRVTIIRSYAPNISLVEVRESALEEVVINVVINALQAFKGISGRAKEVLCTTRNEGTSVILEVSDNAIGVSDQCKDKIFEPFTTSKAGEGMGLGLFVSQLIITDYGGKIEAFNNDDGGATIRIRLPAR